MTEQGLIYRSGGRLQAVALSHVIEIMRPLPIETTGAETLLMKGTSIIRGEQIRILDLASGPRPALPRRLLSLRAGPGRFALLADEVLGVRALPEKKTPVLQGQDDALMTAVNALDADLRAVLQDLRALPDDFDEAQAPAQSPA